MPNKAKYSEPCQRCGTCCALSLCPAAEMAFPEQVAPCPALFWDEDGGPASCGLVMVEKHFTGGDFVTKSLGIGCGCSCPDADTTQAEVEEFDRLSYIQVYGEEVPQAKCNFPA